MTKNAYDGLSYWIKLASRQVKKKVCLMPPLGFSDVGVSVDATWQRKKGFSSTLRVVTAISIDSWKVLDIAILS